MRLEDFWHRADADALRMKYSLDVNLNVLQALPAADLRQLLLEYYAFTDRYTEDLGILLGRLGEGQLKDTLGDILEDEQGRGADLRSHRRLYSDFLVSLGIPAARVIDYRNAANLSILDQVTSRLRTCSLPFAIGARGMGGECLCQIYLEVMYEKFIKNPSVAAEKDRIEWEFWEIHTGPVDQVHRERTREAISSFFTDRPGDVEELSKGFEYGLGSWDAFWRNAFRVIGLRESA